MDIKNKEALWASLFLSLTIKPSVLQDRPSTPLHREDVVYQEEEHMEPLLFFYHILTFLQTHQTPKYILRIASLYAYYLPEI